MSCDSDSSWMITMNPDSSLPWSQLRCRSHHLLGPVGSGKSTLILGLLEELPSSGTTRCAGIKALCGQEFLGAPADGPMVGPVVSLGESIPWERLGTGACLASEAVDFVVVCEGQRALLSAGLGPRSPVVLRCFQPHFFG